MGLNSVDNCHNDDTAMNLDKYILVSKCYILVSFERLRHKVTITFFRVYCASTKQRLVLQNTGKGTESPCMFLALTLSACCHKGSLCLNPFFKNTECQRGCVPHCCLLSLLCLTPASGVLTLQNHPKQRSLFFKSGYYMLH